jgi:hypothetical protein
MGWTTGPKLFSKFAMHLEGDDKTIWADLIDGENQTVMNFDAALKELVASRFLPDDYQVQKRYLMSIRKPADVEPGLFLSLLRFHNRLLSFLPGAPDKNPGLDNEELKETYYSSMPIAWQGKFEDANLTAHGSSVDEIRSYMKLQAKNDPFTGKAIARIDGPRNQLPPAHIGTNRPIGNVPRSTFQRGGQGRNGGQAGSRNSNHNGGRSPAGNAARRIQGSDPCPIPGHTGHTWGRCRANAYNEDRQQQQSARPSTPDTNRQQFRQGVRDNRRSNNGESNYVAREVSRTATSVSSSSNRNPNEANPIERESHAIDEGSWQFVEPELLLCSEINDLEPELWSSAPRPSRSLTEVKT